MFRALNRDSVGVFEGEAHSIIKICVLNILFLVRSCPWYCEYMVLHHWCECGWSHSVTAYRTSILWVIEMISICWSPSSLIDILYLFYIYLVVCCCCCLVGRKDTHSFRPDYELRGLRALNSRTQSLTNPHYWLGGRGVGGRGEEGRGREREGGGQVEKVTILLLL